jgi:hypothetical protein
METSEGVKITGIPWLKQQVEKWISPRRMVAKILCKRHNEALSPLDYQAGRLIRTIGKFDREFNDPEPRPDIVFFSGEDIERWMLKTICGTIASANAFKDRVTGIDDVPTGWVDLLFGKTAWNAPFGLYLKHSVQMRHSRSFFFQAGRGSHDGPLLVADLHLNGLAFVVPVVKCLNPESLGVYRPRTIRFRQGKIIKFMELCWQDPQYEMGIEFQRMGTVKGNAPLPHFVSRSAFPKPLFDL